MEYKDTPDPRHILPTRRLAETRRVTTLDGHTIYLSIGYDPSDPVRPREVFYSAGFKSGSQLEFQIQDACVMFSLLLQHGLTSDDVARSLSRAEQPDGTMAYASVIGLIVEALADSARVAGDC
jgi:hypothetical protein